MHGFNAVAVVSFEVPRGTDKRGQFTWCEGGHPSVVDVDPVRLRRRQLATVQRGVGSRDNRPGLCVRGGFAGAVARIEFLEGGVEVVGIEAHGVVDKVVFNFHHRQDLHGDRLVRRIGVTATLAA